jgi:hypothetical protein
VLTDNVEASIRANGQAMSIDCDVGINIGAFVEPANSYAKMVGFTPTLTSCFAGRITYSPFLNFP